MSGDRYWFWRACCEDGNWPCSPEHPDVTMDGFWRVRLSKLGHWMPLAIFLDGSNLVATLGSDKRRVDPYTYWMLAAPNWVTEAQYRHAVMHGEWWDTLRASKTEPQPGIVVTDVARAEPIGPLLLPKAGRFA